MKSKKSKQRKPTVKQQALKRLHIIQGHLRAIEKMLLDDRYCVDIIHQSKAVQAALKKFNALILSDHLRSCAVEQIKGGEEKQVIEELIDLLD